MAVCTKCSAFFVGHNCGSCGWKVIYKCWRCRAKIDPAECQACACRWFKCPKCTSCGCDADRPKTREAKILAALNSATRKFDLSKTKPEHYDFLCEKGPATETCKDAWAEWPAIKKFPWDYFVTLTFPKSVTQDEAERLWKRYVNKLGKISLPCKTARGVGIPWINSIELHKSGEPHIHALIGHVSNIDSRIVTWMWGAVAGRFDTKVQVSKYDPNGTALRYLTKTADDHESKIAVGPFFKTSTTGVPSREGTQQHTPEEKRVQ